MTDIDWVLLAIVVLQFIGAASSTFMVGKPREPISPGYAVLSWAIAFVLMLAWLGLR